MKSWAVAVGFNTSIAFINQFLRKVLLSTHYNGITAVGCSVHEVYADGIGEVTLFTAGPVSSLCVICS